MFGGLRTGGEGEAERRKGRERGREKVVYGRELKKGMAMERGAWLWRGKGMKRNKTGRSEEEGKE